MPRLPITASKGQWSQTISDRGTGAPMWSLCQTAVGRRTHCRTRSRTPVGWVGRVVRGRV